MKNMPYKMLILDVDGTILPYKRNSLPSARMTDAIKNAAKKVHVALATGRPYFMLEHLLVHLGLTDGILIMNDGAQVMDIKTKQYHYKKPMVEKDVEIVSDTLQSEGVTFFLNDGIKDSTIDQIPSTRMILNVFTMHKMDGEQADRIVTKLTRLPTIKVSKTHYGSTATNYDLLISHAEATKLHGIVEASRILGVKHAEIMGVGDSGNDFPLLMASGFKVAMGNAIDDLKAVADYVAPPVTKDGAAEAIEKFILQRPMD